MDQIALLNSLVRAGDLRREPGEPGGRAGRLQDEHVEVRARVPRGIGIPAGELVEDEEGVLVRPDAEGAVDIDAEAVREQRQHLLEVDLVSSVARSGATEETDHDPRGDREDLPG